MAGKQVYEVKYEFEKDGTLGIIGEKGRQEGRQ